jgi:glycogen debranching enzyme
LRYSVNRQLASTLTTLILQYIRLPPPIKPYILRISIQPGTACSLNGVLKSDFPMDGGIFVRDDWKEKKLPTDISK